MESKPRPRLDDVLVAYEAEELSGWPRTDEELDQFLAEPVDQPYTRKECEAKAALILAKSRRRVTQDVPVAEDAPLFGRFGLGRPVVVKVEPAKPLTDYIDLVRRAYAAVHGGYSIDRMICDPERNALFVQRCWKLGAQAGQFELNWTLLRARKNGQIGTVAGVESYRVAREVMDQYLFASELALRQLQDEAYYQNQADLSLDQILCDPKLAARFEDVAKRLAPGFSSLDYRWAAFTIRKAQQRSVNRVDAAPEFEWLGATRDVRVSKIEKTSGFFWLECDGADIYLGHAENLRAQVDRMFQASGAGTSVIPTWLRGQEDKAMRLAIAPFPGRSPSKREPIKTAYVQTREPLFNVLSRTGSAA